jgi:glycosyltransferase involved in cell wall biosynthesis
MFERKLITIGIPVLNEEMNIEELIARLNPIIDQISHSNLDVEFIVNNNASNDSSASLLDSWSRSDPRVTVYHLSNTIPFQESIFKLLQQS